MDSGWRKTDRGFDAYRHSLKSRLNPTTSVLTQVYNKARLNPKRVVFAEAEDEVVLRAAIQFKEGGYGEPLLVGRDQAVRDKLKELGIEHPDQFEIHNSAISPHVPAMVEHLYARLQRRGYLQRDVRRMVNQERNVFAGLLVALGHADAMITGVTRPFGQSMREVRMALDPKPGSLAFGIHMMIGKNYTVFLADTTINERPSSAELAQSRSAPPRSPRSSATSRASRFSAIRRSATRGALAREPSARRCHSRANPPGSSTKARWPTTPRLTPTWPSIRSAACPRPPTCW